MKEYQIISKENIAPKITRLDVYVPQIARKRKAGQFVIVRSREGAERIPLTIADANTEKGTITLVFQGIGKSTIEMSEFNVGDCLKDVAGPLGSPTHIEKFGTVVCVGGGVGIAPLHPITQAMKAAGNEIISIIGAKSSEYFFLKDEMKALSDELIITTDDGSEGVKGFVTTALQELIDSGRKIDLVVTIGPPIMMKMVAEVTRKYKISTVASLNTIMIDGTGMCGGCRVTIGNETKFVCVDGPEFDAHLVDWDGMLQRQKTYHKHECRAMKQVKS